MSSNPVLLLTGTTGLVGGEILKQLLATTQDRQITVLSRKPNSANVRGLNSKVTYLQGDLTQPNLGLDVACYADLQRSLTEIIHCAADTHFGLSLAQARETNTEGTRNLLELARRSRKLEKFGHISTLFIFGRSTGWLTEAPCHHLNGFFNTYQQSKYEAEELMLEAMSEVPVSIYRLSSIIGDSRSGQVRQFNYVHRLIQNKGDGKLVELR